MRVKFLGLGIGAVSWSQPVRQFLVILASCCAFLLASPLSATNYFVTQPGSGTQDGLSLANAWSVATYLSLGSNSNAPTGGDTVFFSGSITSAIVVASSGTGNGTGRLTLDFSGSCTGCTVVTFSNTGNTINFNNRSFITLNGGNTAAAPTGGATFAANSATQVSCKNSNGSPQTGHDYTIQGFIYIGPTNGTGDFFQGGLCTNVLVQNNWGDNLGHLVNYYQGSVSNITVLNNFGRTSTDTTQDDDVIQIADAVNVTIQGNKLVDRAPGSTCCHNDVIQTFQSGSTTHQHPSNWIIAYNWIEAAQPAGGGGNTSFMEMENLTGQPAIQIYGNLFVGTGVPQAGGNGISVHTATNASDTYYFYNNTVWGHQMPLNPIRLGEGDGPGTLFFRNNAAGDDNSGQGIQATFTAGAAWDYNYFYQYSNCGSTFTGTHGSCSLTTGAFTNTSGNNFSEATGSALVHTGDSSIGAAYNQGICPGATWPNPKLCTRSAGAWDVGAYQQSSTTSTVNPPTNLNATVQ